MIGFIVAGGRSARMGGKRKCLLELAGTTILERIKLRLLPQVQSLVLNANDAEPDLAACGLPIIPDALTGHLGPLAGLHTCLAHAHAHAPDDNWIVTHASDTPFTPDDLIAKLSEVVDDDCDVVIASSRGQAHRLSALWRISLLEPLRAAIVDDEIRAVRHWLKGLRVREVAFDTESLDPFFNINSPEDLIEGERLAALHNL